MLNIEKYKDKILTLDLHFAKKKGELCNCNSIACANCDFSTKEGGMCRKNKLDWLCSEYVEKPTLTEREWHFCMAVKTGWIAKDKDVGLYLHDKKPKKNDTDWDGSGDFYRVPPNLSFDFIEWEDEEPWEVEDLLKLEVIKEEEE